jgi:hypothetical protein
MTPRTASLLDDRSPSLKEKTLGRIVFKAEGDVHTLGAA